VPKRHDGGISILNQLDSIGSLGTAFYETYRVESKGCPICQEEGSGLGVEMLGASTVETRKPMSGVIAITLQGRNCALAALWSRAVSSDQSFGAASNLALFSFIHRSPSSLVFDGSFITSA